MSNELPPEKKGGKQGDHVFYAPSSEMYSVNKGLPLWGNSLWQLIIWANWTLRRSQVWKLPWCTFVALTLSHACSQQGRQNGVMKLSRQTHAGISSMLLNYLCDWEALSPKSQMSLAVKPGKRMSSLIRTPALEEKHIIPYMYVYLFNFSLEC